MRLSQFGFGLAVTALTALPASGALVISEVLFNEAGSNVDGEWIEIYNNGTTAIDLTNFKIGDEETSGGTGTGEAMHLFPAGATIAPGAVQIIARSAAQFNSVYGFLPTYEALSTDAAVPDMSIYSAWDPDGVAFAMGNGGDHAQLMDTADVIVDAFGWDNTRYFETEIVSAEADGQSYQRKNANIDTDTADDWELGPSSDVAAQRSTPGVVPIPEPGSLGLALVGSLLAIRRPRRK